MEIPVKEQLSLPCLGHSGEASERKETWQINGRCSSLFILCPWQTSVISLGTEQDMHPLHPSQHNAPDSPYQSINADMLNDLCIPS